MESGDYANRLSAPRIPQPILLGTRRSARIESCWMLVMWTLEVKMSRRRSVSSVLAIMVFVGMVGAEDRVQSELRFVAHNKDEKTAGVWVDGQYVGYVKELAGEKKLVLLPGKHEIVVRQAWFDERVVQVILEPGQVREINVHLVKSARIPSREATGELKISATPSRAAGVADNQYAA